MLFEGQLIDFLFHSLWPVSEIYNRQIGSRSVKPSLQVDTAFLSKYKHSEVWLINQWKDELVLPSLTSIYNSNGYYVDFALPSVPSKYSGNNTRYFYLTTSRENSQAELLFASLWKNTGDTGDNDSPIFFFLHVTCHRFNFSNRTDFRNKNRLLVNFKEKGLLYMPNHSQECIALYEASIN